MTALAHLTLTTGHVRMSPRAEVADDTLAALRPIVAIGGGTVHGMTIALEPAAPGGRAFALGWSPQPAVRCVLCWDSAHHDRWWTEALGYAGVTLAAFAVQPVPWLAVALVPAAAIRCTRDQLCMLGDAERCVAWALLDALPAT